jgi:hypothetical protein
MIHFTKRITLQNGFDTEFTFKRVFTVLGIRYYVFGIGIHGETIMFVMGQTRDTWKIVNPEELPSWAKKVESQISDAIVQQGEGDESKPEVPTGV